MNLQIIVGDVLKIQGAFMHTLTVEYKSAIWL